ncbi:hypothetical protein [Companilactobacillus furfuricola]|uniref:hypothetical protein n=1 Tax=Companilactobacillus furfuricola TaxID=1462575 RepID=UPI000F7B2115|nr:hypothetical protein [Companilactobacillus furfuricola]
MPTNSQHYRDLTITPLTKTEDLVVSCDISAGFGDRKLDIVKCAPQISVSFTLRTAMLELISYGATPLNVVDTLSVEYDPTGISMIKQMQTDLAEMGFSNIAINGSTEDNLDIQMTTVSVTVIGKAAHRVDAPSKTASVFQLGTPLVGEEVLANLDNIFSVKEALYLRKEASVVDMIPVGSKGIGYELSVLAKSDHQELLIENDIEPTEFNKTAGPSTVLLIVVDNQDVAEFKKNHPHLKQIAELR